MKLKLHHIALPLLAALASSFDLQGQNVGDARGLDDGQSAFYRPLTLKAVPGETAGGGGGGEGEENQEALAKAAQNPVAKLTTAPIITADWTANSDNRWTVPVGGGVGKIQRFGKLPLNIQLSAYYNVETPDSGADWQLRFQVQFLFPK